MTDMQPQANLQEHPEPSGPGHESGEVGLRRLIIFLIGLVLLAGVSVGVVIAFMEYFHGREQTLAKLTPPRFADTRGQFPRPQLQGNPAKDTSEFIAAEKVKLQQYGWSDPKARVATLPIDRAIDLVLEQGLPTEKGESKKSKTSSK